MTSWLYLLLASVCEVGWALGLKATGGFTRFWPSAAVILAMILSGWFLSLAARALPISVAYAVWTGLGVVGTALGGILLYHEPRSALRLACFVLILAGVIGLNLTER